MRLDDVIHSESDGGSLVLTCSLRSSHTLGQVVGRGKEEKKRDEGADITRANDVTRSRTCIASDTILSRWHRHGHLWTGFAVGLVVVAGDVDAVIVQRGALGTEGAGRAASDGRVGAGVANRARSDGASDGSVGALRAWLCVIACVDGEDGGGQGGALVKR